MVWKEWDRVDREGLHGAEMNVITDSGVSGAIMITVRSGIGRPLCGGVVGGAVELGTRSRGGSYNINSEILVVRAEPLSGSGE